MYQPHLERLIDLALEEDVGGGDVTTNACIRADAQARGVIAAKSPCVVSGMAVAKAIFERVDPKLALVVHKDDGAAVKKGDKVLEITGSARSILVAERPALNFMMRLSGVATFARKVTEAVKDHPGVRVVDTRKTTPGHRALEKAAVRHGGAHNHRDNLADGILIKDNHIEAAGGVAEAIGLAQKNATHLLKIEVETADLAQVGEALSAGADVILLDNMDTKLMTQAVELIRAFSEQTGRPVLVEASGNMTLDRLPEVAACGVDLISMGALTHSAPAADLSLSLELLA
jgi:nicotinate-nucleotide pyrophosphorylase (carboxylating)